jgi:hypothetical protein
MPDAIRLPTSPPISSAASTPSSSATNQPDDQQQDQRSDGGIDDRRNDPRAEVDTELRKQPTPDEGAYDPDEEVADNPKAGALNNLTSKPSGNEADQQYDQKTFTRDVHIRMLQVLRESSHVPRAKASPTESG